MINIIRDEFFNNFGTKNTMKAIYNYYWDNSFRVQCKVRSILKKKKGIIRRLCIHNLEIRYGFKLGNESRIGNGFIIHHHEGIIIGEKVQIGDNCEIYQQVTLGSKDRQYPIIGNNVVLYPGSKVIGAIHVGNSAIVGPNSVVVKDVPDNAVVSGIPAKFIKWRT